MPALTTLLRRPVVIAADQGVSSIGNFLLQLAVVRQSDATSLAYFGVTYSVYWLALGSSRALLFEPLLVLAAQQSPGEAEQTRRASLTVTAAWALTIAAATAGAAVVAPGPAQPQLLVLAAGFVPLLLLDALRYAAISSGVVLRALVLDGVWLVVQLAAFAVALAHGAGATLLLALWCSACAASLLLQAWRLRSAFSGARAAMRHWRAVRSLGVPGAGEFALASGLQQLLPSALLLVGGVTVAASYRIAQTMVSPVNVLSSAATVAALPRAADGFAHRDHARVRRTSAVVAAVLATVGLLVALAYAVLPSSVLVGVFGDMATDARTVAVVLAVQFAVYGVQLGAVVVLRSARRARSALAITAATGPLLLLAPVLGASVASAVGAAVGLLFATAISLPVWAWAARRSLTQEIARTD